MQDERVGDVSWCFLVPKEEEEVFISSSQRAVQRSRWGDLASQLADPALVLNVPHPSVWGRSGYLSTLRLITTSPIFQNPDEAENQGKYYTSVSGSCLCLTHLERFLGNTLVFFPSSAFNCSSFQQPACSPAFKWTMPPCRTVHPKTYV